MNKDRRKQLEELANRIDIAKSDLETLKDEEQEYYDNMPEGLQQGDKGQAAEQAVSYLEDAINELESALGNIQSAQEG